MKRLALAAATFVGVTVAGAAIGLALAYGYARYVLRSPP